MLVVVKTLKKHFSSCTTCASGLKARPIVWVVLSSIWIIFQFLKGEQKLFVTLLETFSRSWKHVNKHVQIKCWSRPFGLSFRNFSRGNLKVLSQIAQRINFIKNILTLPTCLLTCFQLLGKVSRGVIKPFLFTFKCHHNWVLL